MSFHDVAAFFWNLFSECAASFWTSGGDIHERASYQASSMLNNERDDSIDIEDDQEDDLKNRPKLLYMLNTEKLNRRNALSSGANEPSNDSLKVEGTLRNRNYSQFNIESDDLTHQGFTAECNNRLQRAVFHQLTQGEKKTLYEIINGPNRVVCDKAKIQLDSVNLKCLCNGEWLNDEAINVYFALLQERSDNAHQKHLFFNTFFYPLLCQGYQRVKNWTKRLNKDVFACSRVFIPVHLGSHWCLAVVDVENNMLCYFDSMGGENKNCLAHLKEYLEKESLDKRKVALSGDWTEYQGRRSTPQQDNMNDCGVFTCKTAEWLSFSKQPPKIPDEEFKFSARDMPNIRETMMIEIINGKLYDY